jgi:hypothetical protein
MTEVHTKYEYSDLEYSDIVMPPFPDPATTRQAVHAILALYDANWPRNLTAWQSFIARFLSCSGVRYRFPDFPGLVTVVWTLDPMPRHPGVTGVFVAPAEVRVRPSARLSETALSHELMHLALLARRGTADPDHLGSYYRGWTQAHEDLVYRADTMLKTRGL